jgi:tetratricopeptide (TPR) repeat protein
VYVCVALALSWLVGCANPIQQGIRLEGEGKYAEAISLYAATAAKKPGTPAALQAQLRIGDAYTTGLNDPAKALEAYQNVANASPKSPEGLTARYKIGLHYFREENYPKAEEVFRAIANDVPTEKTGADAQLMLARTLEQAKKLDEAAQMYSAFTTLHGSSDDAAIALLRRAKLMEQLGRQQEAVEAYQQVVREFGAREDLAEQVKIATEELTRQGESVPQPAAVTPATTAAPPTAEMSRQERVSARREFIRERDRPASARQAAAREAAANIWGVNADALMSDIIQQMGITPDRQGTMYDAMLMVAVMMYQDGEYKKSGALYERAIELAEADQDRRGAWDSLGNAYKGLADVFGKLGLQDRARDFIQRASRGNPQIIDQILDGARFDYEAGDYDTAINTWLSVQGLNPGKDSEIYYYVALAYKRMKDTENEVAYFERAVGANPSNKDALQNLAEALYYRAGQRERSFLVDDIAKNTPNAAAYDELGQICFKHGFYANAQLQFQMAERLAEKPEDKAGLAAMKTVARARKANAQDVAPEMDALVQANPNNARVHYAAGLLAVTLDDAEKAEAELRQAMQLAPRDKAPLLALADFYVSKDRTDAALALLDGYLETNPNDRQVLRRRDMLRAVKSPVPPPTTSARPPVN